MSILKKKKKHFLSVFFGGQFFYAKKTQMFFSNCITTWNYAASSSMLAPFHPLHPRHLPPRPPPSAHSGLPSRPHTTASSGAWESEVTTLTASPHLRGCPGRGRLPPGQTPPSRLDDRGNHPVPGAQQGAYGSLHSNWPSWTTATMVIPQRPLPASFRPLLEVSVLPSLRRLGRRPHLSRLPLHQTCGGPPLQLSHSSHGSALGYM